MPADLDLLQSVIHLAAAWGLGLVLGLERGKAARSAGFRTFPLVSLGACAYLLLGKVVVGDNADAEARLIQGLMTGIGFVGGGAILKTGSEVHGLATAASLWNAGAIGLAVADSHYVFAGLLAVINLVTLHLFQPAYRHEPPQRD